MLEEINKLLVLRLTLKTNEFLLNCKRSLENGFPLTEKQESVIKSISKEKGIVPLINIKTYGICDFCMGFGTLLAVKDNINYAFKCQCEYGQTMSKDFTTWDNEYLHLGYKIYRQTKDEPIFSESQRKLLARFTSLVGSRRIPNQNEFLDIFLPVLEELIRKRDKESLNKLLIELQEVVDRAMAKTEENTEPGVTQAN